MFHHRCPSWFEVFVFVKFFRFTHQLIDLAELLCQDFWRRFVAAAVTGATRVGFDTGRAFVDGLAGQGVERGGGAAGQTGLRLCDSLFHGFQQVGGLGKNGKGGLLAVKII